MRGILIERLSTGSSRSPRTPGEPTPFVLDDWEDAFALPPKAETFAQPKEPITTVVLSLSDDDDDEEDSYEQQQQQPRNSRNSATSYKSDPILLEHLSRDTYFEVVEYDDEDEVTSPQSEIRLSDRSDSYSSDDMGIFELELEGAAFPSLECTSVESARIPAFAPSRSLLNWTPPAAPLGNDAIRKPLSAVPSFAGRGSWGLFLLDEALARRYAAAYVLTGGPNGLPIIPIAIASLILEHVLSLSPWLSHFAITARVDVTSALTARRIDISSCKLKTDAADMIGWLMRQSTTLQSLDVSGNALGVRGAAAIGRALPQVPGLRSLRMNDIEATSAGGTDPSGLVALAAGIRGHPSLRKLSLRGNGIGAGSGSMALRALIGAVVDPRNAVRALDLSNNPLGHEGAELLAQALSAQPSLTRLDAASCCLTGAWGKLRDGVRALAAALAASDTIEVLNLKDNALGQSSEAMDQWHLDDRNVTACPVVFLVEALLQNESLHTMKLTANHIVGDQEERLRAAWGTAGRCASQLEL